MPSKTFISGTTVVDAVWLQEVNDFVFGGGQTLDPMLTALAALVTSADDYIYFTGVDTPALDTITAFARTILDDANAAAVQTTLGLLIGTDVQAYDADLAALAGLVSAANKLPYFTGAGSAALTDFTAFARTLLDDADADEARLTLNTIGGASFYNVKSAGATGDGVTDDTTDVQTAVTAAAAVNGYMFWPEGTYLTTASITNLHSVRHMGPGVLKRGTDLFAVDPEDTDTNIIYVDTTGNDANDGLTSSQPFATLQAAVNKLLNYGGALTGTWRFILAASTLTEDNIAIPNLMYSNNPIEIQGPDVSGGTPTAIISGSGGSSDGIICNRKIEARLHDIKFTTFGARAPVRISQHSDVETDNVHVDGAGKGIAVDEQSKARIKVGLLDNCSIAAVDVRHSNASVGLNGVFSGPTIGSIGACAVGVNVLEVSDVHVDDLTIDGCTDVAVRAGENSRATLNGTVDLKNNAVALKWQENGVLEIPGTVDFNDGTVDANTINEQKFGAIPVSGLLPWLKRNSVNDGAFSDHTGDTVETTLKTYTDFVRSNTFAFDGKSLNIKITHVKTGAAGTAILRIKVGVNTIATYTLPAAAADGVTETFFLARGVNIQKTRIFGIDGIGGIFSTLPSMAAQTFTLDDTVGDLDLTITIQLANSGDTVSVDMVEIDEVG